MIQRVQTVFLLIAAICMAFALVLPLATFDVGGDTVALGAVANYKGGQFMSFNWFLLIAGGLSILLSSIAIFLFKNRKLQVKTSLINIFVIIVFYLLFVLSINPFIPITQIQGQMLGIGLIVPVVALIFILLAIRKIKADEALVRSLDRLR